MSTPAPPPVEAATAPPVGEHGHHHDRIGPRRLLAILGFRRLLFSRFAAQWGDGLFQAGLAGAVVFNPERGASPLEIAGGFAVLLLPYSLVGPFAGALLDRWDRRRVLVAANLLRGALVIICAACVALGVSNGIVLMQALIVVGISRFVLSGLSASLPHVVPVRNLVEANALAATLGACTAVVGAVCAVALRSLFGSGNVGSGLATAVAAVGSVLAAWLAIRFARGALGPDEVDEPAEAMLAVARGMFDGGRAALHAPTVTAGFVALFAHRAAVSISFLVAVLLMKYTFVDGTVFKAGLPGLAQLLAAGALGILAAGLTTARIVHRFGRRRTVAAVLVLAAASQLGFGLPMALAGAVIGTFLIIYAGQVVKLCVDAAVQRDIGDEHRGRVFALYDALFNITQVVAVSLTALVVADNGQSPELIVAATAFYLLGLLGFVLLSRRHPVSA